MSMPSTNAGWPGPIAPATVAGLSPAPLAPQPAPSAAELAAIAAMTQDVFGRAPALHTECDPEGGDCYIVVEVPVQGSDDEVFALTQAWHRRLAKDFTPSASYALSPLFA